MIRHSLSAAMAALLLATGGAQAQGFFERLFGITPSPPPASAPSAPPPSSAPSDDAPKRTAPPPQPARPVAMRAPNEDAVIGRELKQHGSNGSLRLERAGRGDVRLKMTVVGRRSQQSVEICQVAVGGPDGVPLVSQGRPEGAPRYTLSDAGCPLQIDVLDEAVVVKGPTEICVFTAPACQADPSGLWGPEPAQLLGRAKDYEQARGAADKAVRDNYKVLVQRANPQGVRPIVAEQAAFSSDREMVCRSYAREGSHSFCNARMTEHRALALATRLGVSTQTAANQPNPELRRRRNDAMGLPATEELVQRRSGGAGIED